MSAQAARIEMTGQKELARRIRKIKGNLDDFKEANAKAANTVAVRARTLAPKRSGKLAKSIRPGATKRRAVARAGNNRNSKSGVPYAGPIHWGWPARHIKANPFMSVAAQQTEPQWVKYYKLAADKAIAQSDN